MGLRRLAAAVAGQGALLSLDLSGNPGLGGTIPSSIYLLGALTSISFANTAVSGLLPSTLAYLSDSLIALNVSGTRVGGLLPPVPRSLYPVLVSTLPVGPVGSLCSRELLLTEALPVKLTVKSSTALLASWLPPQGAPPAALSCLIGYKLSLAPCSDADTQGGCQGSAAWDSGSAVQGIQAYSPSGLPFAPFAAAAPYLVPGANLSSGLLPASSDATAYLQYALTGLTTARWYKVAVQAVDRDGNTNYAPGCTLMTATTTGGVTAACPTAQSPRRPLRSVTVGEVGSLRWGVVSGKVAITVDPEPEPGLKIFITPTVSGGLAPSEREEMWGAGCLLSVADSRTG